VKRYAAALVTLAVVVAIVRWKSGDSAPGDPGLSPHDCVQQMFAAAMEGDVERYLACFGEPELGRLAREFSYSDPAAPSTREALRRSVQDLKGWALLDPPTADESSSCRLTVEWVYATRVDRQRLELRRDGGRWRIVRVESVQPTQPPIPYGTPIYGQPLRAEE
jgi:hypothetical protein